MSIYRWQNWHMKSLISTLRTNDQEFRREADEKILITRYIFIYEKLTFRKN